MKLKTLARVKGEWLLNSLQDNVDRVFRHLQTLLDGLDADIDSLRDHDAGTDGAISTIRKDLDGYNQTITEHYVQHSDAFDTIRKDLDGYNTTIQEHYTQHSTVFQTILKDLDGYNQTITEHYTQHSDAIQTILKDLDGYSTATNLDGLNQTVEEHYNQHSAAFNTILKDLDGYNTTIQEHYTQHSGAFDTIRKDLDGYVVLPPSGSGGDGYVAFFTGGTELGGDNDLYWDRANNRLGIGTTSPQNKLDVGGSVAIGSSYSGTETAPADSLIVQDYIGVGHSNPAYKLSVYSGTQYQGLNIENESNTIAQIVGLTATNDDAVFDLYSGGEIKIRLTASSEVNSYINSGANFGIGTTNPQNALDVEGSVAIGASFSGTETAPANSLIVESYVGIGEENPAHKLSIESATQYQGIHLDNGTNTVAELVGFAAANDDGGLDLYSGGVVKVRINANSGLNSYINSGANFGIGTTSPTYNLEVIGDMAVFASSSDDEGLNIQTVYSNGNSSSRIFFRESSTKTYGFSLFYAGQANQTFDGQQLTLPANTLGIHRHSNSAAGVTVMAMQRDTGYVGIGVDTPTNKLTIDGGITVTDTTGTYEAGNLGYTDANWGFLYRPPRAGGIAAHHFQSYAGGSLVTITEGANVGIYNDSPKARLDVGGDITRTEGAYLAANLYWDSGFKAKTTGYSYYEAISAGKFQIVVGDTAAADAAPSFSTAVTIDCSNGNVGIGTDAPDALLHIQGTDTSAVFRMQDLGTFDPAITRTMSGIEIVGNEGNTTNKYSPAIKFMTTDSAFETENPKLGACILARCTSTYSDDEDGAMALDFATTDVNPGAESVPSVAMTIDDSGYVGIGTTDPSSQLHLKGTAPIIRLEDSAATAYSQISGNSAIGGLVLSADVGNDEASSYMAFQVDGSDYMRILSNGNVGIGTTSPDTILHLQSTGDAVLKIEADSDNVNEGDNAYILFAQDGDAISATMGLVGAAGSGHTGNITGTNDNAFVINHPSTTYGDVQIATESIVRMTITDDGNVGIGTTSPSEALDVNADAIRVRTSQTPASAGATGTTGMICWDSSYIYVCTATNTWKRAALSTW